MTNRLLPVAILGCVFAASGADANPQGGTVVGGQATIAQPTPNDVTVKQQSSKAIIDWQSFSIGKQESVQFSQPSASSVALNRVVGNDLSTIAGSLSANGIVFLVNPNGVVFTRTAKVDVNGMIATTNDIANADFMAGTYNFTLPGLPESGVVNEGTITAAQGGLVGLVAPWVRNDGVITAQLGRISLASGDAFTVDLYGDQLIQFAVPVVPTNDAPALNGALVTNTGTLSAKGGTIALTADTAERIVNEAINTKGLIEASAVHEQGGDIVLDGGPNGGVTVAGTLDASGKSAGQTGGTVKVLGANVTVNAGAAIDVSGDAGGGTALIGGNFHGQGPEQNAATTTITANATIDADALNTGNGGQVAVWSNDQTTFDGTISAKGGAVAGNGGFVEVSGHQQLAFDGIVDLLAPAGQPGTLLLDPENVTIAATGDTPTLPTSGDTTLTGTSDNSVLAVSTLLNALSLGNVTVQTGTSGTQAGDIEVAANVGWSGANSLTLSAYRNITVDDGVTIANIGSGNLSLRADNTGTGAGTVVFDGTGKWYFAQSTGTVSIYYNPPDNPAGSGINSTSYTDEDTYNQQILSGEARGGGIYMLVNSVYDLQNIQNNLAGDYALGRDIEASATEIVGTAGFQPLGTTSHPFAGLLDGNNRTITDLTIAYLKPPALSEGLGLFDDIGTEGIVRNLNIAAENIDGTTNDQHGPVGGLAGINQGQIKNVSVSGSIVGLFGSTVGGLVGENDGTIELSAGNASVGGCCNGIGGLVGTNQSGASITQSSAAGTVYYAQANSGLITPGGWWGGLVGWNDGNISQSYSAATVTAGYYGGGFAGFNSGNISQSYAVGSVSAIALSGGFAAQTGGGSISESFATGAVVLVPTVYNEAQGGFVAYNTDSLGATVTNSYWDIQSTGQSSASGYGTVSATGLTTAEFQSGILPAGFDSSVWNAVAGQYPVLKWQTAPTGSSPTAVNFGNGVAPPPTQTPLTWDVANASSTYGTLATLGDATLFDVSAGDNGSVEGMVGLFSGTTPVSLSAVLSAGTYIEEVTGLTGSAASKYFLSPTGDTVGTLTINRKPLTWSVANASASFGTVPTLGNETLNGVLPADTANVYGTIGLFNDTTPVALSNAIPVGSYGEKITALTGLASSNYTLGTTGNTPGTLTIINSPPTTTPLTWSVANASSTYGTLAAPGDTTLFGVTAGDTVEGIVGLFSGTTPVILSATLPAGTYSEDVTGLSGLSASKYSLGSTEDTIGTLTINPKPITWSVANASSTFGTLPTLGKPTLAGVLSVDSNNVLGSVGAFNGATPVALSTTTPVGTYAEDVTGLDGPASSNYVLATIGNSPGTLNITSATTSPPTNGTPQQQIVLMQLQSQQTNNPIISPTVPITYLTLPAAEQIIDQIMTDGLLSFEKLLPADLAAEFQTKAGALINSTLSNSNLTLTTGGFSILNFALSDLANAYIDQALDQYSLTHNAVETGTLRYTLQVGANSTIDYVTTPELWGASYAGLGAALGAGIVQSTVTNLFELGTLLFEPGNAQ